MVSRIAFCFVGLLTLSSQAWCWFEPPAPIEHVGNGYTLLQNGNVLKGRISRVKDKLAIALDGSTLYLDPRQVEYSGPTLESLYLHQRNGVRVWGTGEHWHLAHWCIQNGMLSQAIEHYQVLEATASDSPKFKQLEMKLKEAILADERVRALVQPARMPHEASPQPTPMPFPTPNTGVALAHAEVPGRASEPESVVPKSPFEKDVWTKHEMPSYLRKSFQTSVLPVLVSRCGQSGCHGLLGKSDFHIYQPVGDQAASMLAQDLDTVLRYIDRENSHESELLAYATKAHGIQKNPSLNPAREDERVLVERINQWIKSLAMTQRHENSMPVQFPVSSAGHIPLDSNYATQAVATSPTANSSGRPKRSDLMRPTETRDRSAKLSKPPKEGAPMVFLDGRELSELETMIEQLESRSEGSRESNQANVPRDPFDPNVFNQKYR
jgi:hypothetical protein